LNSKSSQDIVATYMNSIKQYELGCNTNLE